MNLNDLLNIAISTAVIAGKETLKFYGKPINVDIKADDSPLTQADLDANKAIVKELTTTNIPILSEENKPEDYRIRKSWQFLWVVDPLDGTKEFVKQSDEYTVNIALVKDDTPILGVVYAPAKKLLFFGLEGQGAYKVENISGNCADLPKCLERKQKLPTESISGKTVVVASKSHRNPETEAFIKALSEKGESVEDKSFGSSLKLCMVADGSAHIYPRMGPTVEWDTAASHAIVLAAGCNICQYPSMEKLVYNKENLLNPWFVVFSPEKSDVIN